MKNAETGAMTTRALVEREGQDSPDRVASVSVVLPWACIASDNLRKGLDRTLYAKYKRRRDNAHLIAMTSVDTPHPVFPDEPLRITLDYYQPNIRRRDLSNTFKMVFDALEGVVYADDYQIKEGGWADIGVSDNPRVEITVEAI
jgi:Holliday junction resolvase RusA-like endonuclease